MYQNEALLGQALADLNVARDNFFIATKVNEANQGYEATIASVKESLKKLRMDYVDLLMVHWPIHTHFFETWRAFEDLKKSRVDPLDWGSATTGGSTCNTWQLRLTKCRSSTNWNVTRG